MLRALSTSEPEGTYGNVLGGKKEKATVQCARILGANNGSFASQISIQWYLAFGHEQKNVHQTALCDRGSARIAALRPAARYETEKLAGNFEYSTESLYTANSVEQVRDFVKRQVKSKVLGTRHCFQQDSRLHKPSPLVEARGRGG